MITALTKFGMMGLLVALAMTGTKTQKPDNPNTPKTKATKTPTTRPTATTKAQNRPAKNIAPLPIKLPKPKVPPTPKPLPPGVRVKIPHNKWTPRKPFLAPKGCSNVARGRRVSASDNDPVIGQLSQITDGNKEGSEDSYVELGYGVQWVQIDLGTARQIHAIVAWHEHRLPIVYHDVIVQVSDDKDFIENVRTLFNNDHDNSAGMGIGEDWGYFETYEGRLFPTKAARARYVRLYSNGNTGDDLNRYTEVEVYAVGAETKKAAKIAPAGQPGKSTR